MADVAEELGLVVVGPRVAFGPLRRELLPLYQSWVNDREVAMGVGYARIFTAEAEAAWYENAAQATDRTFFTVYDCSDHAPIGTSGLTEVDFYSGCATFGIMIGDRRGQGLGTEATRLTLDWAFHVLGLENVWLQTYAWNVAALRAYEKAGFREVGRRRQAAKTMGQRFDVVVMDARPEDLTGSVLSSLVPGTAP